MRAARKVGRASRVVVVTDKDDSQTETRIAGEIEDQFKRVGTPVNVTVTRSEVRGANEYQYGLLVTFLALMAVLLALVGGLGLMGTMSINVLERIREIGVLRAIGASDGAVMRIIITEGVFIGLISWMLGVALSWPIAHYLDVALGNTLLHTELLDTFSYSGAALWLVLVVVVSGLASFVPAARAARLSVREVLSYE